MKTPMTNPLDLRQLQFFLRAVESGSISRAAATLHVAQPSVSERIRALEVELGVRLLHRAPSGVTPTDIGLMVADRARALLRASENLIAEARSAGAAPSGEVMVGLPASLALHLTVPLALQARAQLPGVSLRISEGMSGHIQEWILAGRLDLAILYTADAQPQLDMGEVIHEELALISQALVPASPVPTPPVTMATLGHYPLVLPAPDHGLRRTIERAVAAAGGTLNVAVEVDSLINLKRLAMEGSLHTILPRAACLEEIEAGKLIARRITAPSLRRPVVIVTPRDRPLTLAGEKIRDLLTGLLRQALLHPIKG